MLCIDIPVILIFTTSFKCWHIRVFPASTVTRIQARGRYFGLVMDCCGLQFSCSVVKFRLQTPIEDCSRSSVTDPRVCLCRFFLWSNEDLRRSIRCVMSATQGNRSVPENLKSWQLQETSPRLISVFNQHFCFTEISGLYNYMDCVLALVSINIITYCCCVCDAGMVNSDNEGWIVSHVSFVKWTKAFWCLPVSALEGGIIGSKK